MERNFYPGDSWLYYKIYCSKYISNEIILNPLSQITNELINQKIVNKWFFIRYEDPDFHLRLRFHVNNTDDIPRVMNYVKDGLKEYLNEQIIWKLQIDTYKREIERYGGESIKSAEEIFFHDSILAINLLKFNLNDDFLILSGVKYIDECLISFKISDSQKLEFVTHYNSMFQKEFNMNIKDRKRLNKRYKLLEKKIRGAIVNDENSEYSFLNGILDERTKTLESEINNIKKSESESFYNILGSIIHMGINRFFFENQRLYEMICYDYLAKFYTSMKWLKSLKK